MGSCYRFISGHGHHPLLFLLFLLLCLTPMRFHAQATSASKEPMHGAKKEVDKKMMARALIGSQPPRCQRRCVHCGGHCEAVQVPAVPQDRAVTVTDGHHDASGAGINSRGDDSGSNYKPVSWKCKCGDTIVNP